MSARSGGSQLPLRMPLLALLFFLASCSSQETSALAFFIQRRIHAHRFSASSSASAQTAKRKGHNNPLSHEYVATEPLCLRGGGWSAASPSSSTGLHSAATPSIHNDDDGESDDETSRKIANAALRSIRYCCKMCFFSFFADIFILLVGSDIWSRFIRPKASLTWVDCVDIFDTLSMLVFGSGMWRVSNLYWDSLVADMDRQMTRDELSGLFTAMAWIWGVVATNMAMTTVSGAAALSAHAGEGGPFGFVFDAVSPRVLAMSAMVVLGIGGIVVQRGCEAAADREIRAYKEKNQKGGGEGGGGNGKEGAVVQPTRLLPAVRNAGFRAYRNQALCAGLFAIVAGLELVKWIASLHLNIVGHVFSVSDFLTPLSVSGLLFVLNRALLRAAIVEIRRAEGNYSTKVDDDDQVYRDLFLAQSGLYNKVAEDLKGATIFHLLPYIAAPIIPPLLKALKKMSPFVRAIEAFGIQV